MAAVLTFPPRKIIDVPPICPSEIPPSRIPQYPAFCTAINPLSLQCIPLSVPPPVGALLLTPFPSALCLRPALMSARNCLAPSSPKSSRNDYDSALRYTGGLQHALSEDKSSSIERTHTPVCFQVGLPVGNLAHGAQLPPKPGLTPRT